VVVILPLVGQDYEYPSLKYIPLRFLFARRIIDHLLLHPWVVVTLYLTIYLNRALNVEICLLIEKHTTNNP